MDFTFGVITSGGNDDNLNLIVDTIEKLAIGKYEILVIGASSISRKNVKVVPFNEAQKIAWITRKKNLITNLATYENIVYLHDYVVFNPDWYKGFLKSGDDFKLCMNIILDKQGKRYRDWTLWVEDGLKLGVTSPNFLLPYSEGSLSKYMYFSGAYWVAKKHVMLEFPLNETLCWDQGEDVEWSKRVRQKYNFSMNPFSKVELIKDKHAIFRDINEQELKRIKGVI